MKFFGKLDRNGDGEFDFKDVLLMVSVLTTFMNLILNLFSVLDIGVTFTNQQKPIIECSVVQKGDNRNLKCYRPATINNPAIHLPNTK